MPLEINRATVRRLQTMLTRLDRLVAAVRRPEALKVPRRPPSWLCNVATQTYSPDVSKSLGEFGAVPAIEPCSSKRNWTMNT